MSSTPSTHSDANDRADDHVLVVPAQPGQVRRVTQFVRHIAASAGFAELALHQIELAVDEASTNIIQHAYAGRHDGDIRIVVHAQAGRNITIALIDTGAPFDPGSVPQHNPNAPLADMKVGGLGLYLMRQMMDDVRFEFDVVGTRPNEPRRFNRLTMIKTI